MKANSQKQRCLALRHNALVGILLSIFSIFQLNNKGKIFAGQDLHQSFQAGSILTLTARS